MVYICRGTSWGGSRGLDCCNVRSKKYGVCRACWNDEIQGTDLEAEYHEWWASYGSQVNRVDESAAQARPSNRQLSPESST
eukprot:5642707-Lingulodinium_polyedra.AAC.1